MNRKKPSVSSDVVDMEMDCVTCGTRLYVPDAAMNAVLASFKRTGAAILVCVCGQAQIVRWSGWHQQNRNN